MSSPSFRRAAAALVLGWTLLSSWASAAGLRSQGEHRSGRHAAHETQTFFGQLWMTLASLWSKNGASADPSGLPGGQATAGFCDAGASIDPSGRCASSATTAGFCDNGASIDPSGRCASGH
jgi:hypothetical protein